MQAWARRSFKLYFYYLPLLKSMIYMIYNGHISRYLDIAWRGIKPLPRGIKPSRGQGQGQESNQEYLVYQTTPVSSSWERNQTNSERNQTSQGARDFCLFWLFCLLGVESNQLREESNLSYGQTHVRGQYRAHMELACILVIMTSSIYFMQGGRYSAFLNYFFS